ncbi:heat shock protein transcriptional repressor HspR [Arsenicicoccus sp. oral taxon 190]|uniref:heat shock protein transcriptional repressor HspR n=1 Tax=Arsenicicoccus sp. oral taxon 190 TaxID=1658671 RepID=UPI000679EAAC|nr:helix-turn-helix transcriptional regulator [Arsenicicoccus sp. oral taxon 190]AKT50385.1 heat-shock protein [Arsenicicoccus sp. oral taxon 190]
MAVDDRFQPDEDAPLFVISVAAELAGMHAQTLRQYDRLGLVTPHRTGGGGRRYSQRDVAQLREVQRLSQEEGVSLSGIRRILELEDHVSALRSRVEELTGEVDGLRAIASYGHRVFAAGRGEIVAMPPGRRPRSGRSTSQALVVWRPEPPR